MPTYTFRDKNSGEEWDDIMSISDKEKYLEENPHIEQLIFKKALGICDPVRLSVRKPDHGFNDVLKKVKAAHPLGNVREHY